MIAALTVMVCIWVSLLKIGARRAAFPAIMVFALLPLSVRLGRTTNYEPISLAIISLIFVGCLWREKWWGIMSMCALAVIGGIFEWTVYLAFPALAIAVLIKEKNIRSLKPLVVPSLLAAVTLVLLFAYQYKLLGHVQVLRHVSVRSNPISIWDFSAWGLFTSRFWVDTGWVLILCIWGFIVVGAHGSKSLKSIVGYFILVPILFFILASQLVLAHPIAQYYLAPAIAISIGVLFEEQRRFFKWCLLIIALVGFVAKDVNVLKERSLLHYNLARLVAESEPNGSEYLSFDSSAVGYLRFYHGIETLYPLGGNEPPATEIVSNIKVRYVILDMANPEVAYVRDYVSDVHGLHLKWRFAEAEVWQRDSLRGEKHLTNEIMTALLPKPTGKFWETPKASMMEVDGRIRFGIFHHPRKNGDSTIIFKNVPTGRRFETAVHLDPNVCDEKLTDGVSYSLTIGDAGWFRHFNGVIAPIAGSCSPKKISVDLEGAPPAVDVTLTTTPMGNSAFDRFFWEDPMMISGEE